MRHLTSGVQTDTTRDGKAPVNASSSWDPANAGVSPESQQTRMPYPKALTQGALLPVLPAPALQEAADASSGQTQHILRGTPQQEHDKGDQPQMPAASVVLLSTEHGQQTGCAERETLSPGNGGAQSRPATVGRPAGAKAAGQEHRLWEPPAAAEPPASCAMELLPGRAAPEPQDEARQSVRGHADIVDLVSSSSDDSWSSMPAAQPALQSDVQSAHREGVLHSTHSRVYASASMLLIDIAVPHCTSVWAQSCKIAR